MALSKTEFDCPNCGSPLFSGHENATGGILVCQSGDDPPQGCAAAWDPSQLGTAEVTPPGPWDAKAAPEIGPAPEGVDVSELSLAAQDRVTDDNPKGLTEHQLETETE